MRSILMPPRLKIANLPTPIEPLSRLSNVMNGPRLYIKRDDLTGLALGGNKTRKLEYLLAEAQANGSQTLITGGAAQSNHCRQTAAAAARFGFDCILVLTGDEPPNPSGNLLLDKLLGAHVIWTTRNERDRVLRRTFESAWQEGLRPYLIPYGGSNTLGAAAYAFAIEELLNQISANPDIPHLDWIVFATSSGGTQAGMVLGARLFGYHGRILGISVDEPAGTLKDRIEALAEETAVKLGEGEIFSLEEIEVNDQYLGKGYGVMGEPEKEAIDLFARFEGILLDPVYTGRAAAGLIDLVRKGVFRPDETVLFWHTGGTPALFADQYRSAIDQLFNGRAQRR